MLGMVVGLGPGDTALDGEPASVKSFIFFKFKMAAAATLKNRKFAISRVRFDQFQPNLSRQRNSTI